MSYEKWVPKTELGKKVMNGEITSLDNIFENGYKISEPEIIDKLIPGLKSEIIFIGGSPGKGGGIRRTPTKRKWINKIRSIRRYLKELKEKIPLKTYRLLYRRAKGGFFRDTGHIKTYVKQHKIVKEETK